MKGNDNLLSVFDAMWAISPEAYHVYMPMFANIIANGTQAVTREIDASINYILDEDGQKVSSRDVVTPPNSIGVVNLIGPMIRYGNYWFWGADELVAMLQRFDRDPNIIGTILKIDTGGGSTKAVAPYRDFLKTKKKPVVSLADTSASSGLWVQSATDYRMASNNITAQFGSIGVMAHFLTYQKYLADLGIKEHTVYSDFSEDKNKAFELAMEGKYELIKKEHLNPLALKFQDDIKSDLPKLDLNVEGILTGKMFYAEDALEHGFIQEIGNEQLAVERLKELAAVHTFMNN